MPRNASVLIIEPEYLIALEMERVLVEAGVKRTYIARTGSEAIEIIASDSFDLAFIAIPSDPAAVNLVCDRCIEAGLGVVAVSFDTQHRDGLPDMPGVRVLLKPFADAELIEAADAALQRLA